MMVLNPQSSWSVKLDLENSIFINRTIANICLADINLTIMI